MAKIVKVLCILLLLIYTKTSGQNIKHLNSDSLIFKSYSELHDDYKKALYSGVDGIIYLKVYLAKAKSEKDSLRISKAFKAIVNHTLISNQTREGYNRALQYSDSLIAFSKSLKPNSLWVLGYSLKAYTYYQLADYQKTFDLLKITDSLAKEINNKEIIDWCNDLLLALYNETGNYNEAIKAYKANLASLKLENTKSEEAITDKLLNLSNLTALYLAIGKVDSAKIYLKEGYSSSINYNNEEYYHDFLKHWGKTFYLEKQYNKALDSLNKALPFFTGRNLGVSYYYKAKTHDALGAIDSAVIYIQKADSIFENTKDPFDELLDGYQYLIKHYKQKNDVENQLKYINKYIHLDSILENNSNYLSDKINKNYVIPKLLKEKEEIIGRLKTNREQAIQLKFFLLALLGIAVVLFVINLWKQQTYKKRFKVLMEEAKVTKQQPTVTRTISTIPDKVVKEVLSKLDKFEKDKKFLEPLTLADVAQYLDTNTSYLSKIINTYKQKKFNQYLNDLRVEYAVERLKEDEIFRMYSIKAIAQEIGFSSAESFSKAFNAKTGIYPSYFIKQLKNKKAS